MYWKNCWSTRSQRRELSILFSSAAVQHCCTSQNVWKRDAGVPGSPPLCLTIYIPRFSAFLEPVSSDLDRRRLEVGDWGLFVHLNCVWRVKSNTLERPRQNSPFIQHAACHQCLHSDAFGLFFPSDAISHLIPTVVKVQSEPEARRAPFCGMEGSSILAAAALEGLGLQQVLEIRLTKFICCSQCTTPTYFCLTFFAQSCLTLCSPYL